MYAQEHSGACPHHLQEPYGKILNISFIGAPPYIIYNPLGGSEFIVTALLAKKFHFVPNYIPAFAYDPLEDEDSTLVGMVSSSLHNTTLREKNLFSVWYKNANLISFTP